MNRLKIIKKRAERKGIFVTKVNKTYYVVDTNVWMGNFFAAKGYRDAVVQAYHLAMSPPIVINIFNIESSEIPSIVTQLDGLYDH